MSSVAKAEAPLDPPAVRVTRSRRPVAWTGLAAVLAVGILGYLPQLVYSGTTDLMMRSRLGLVLTAVRDDEIGAHSIGARVRSARHRFHDRFAFPWGRMAVV